jgi:chromosome segregation ATPase
VTLAPQWLSEWLPRKLFEAITTLREEIIYMGDELRGEINALRDDIAAQSTVLESAETLLQGLHDQLEAALSGATQQGVDPAALQDLRDLSSQLQQQTQALAQAVEANTPAQQPGNQGGTGATGATGAAGDAGGATGATGATGDSGS